MSAPQTPAAQPTADELAAVLRDWMPRQRWFAGRTAGVADLSVRSDVVLVEEPAALHHVVVAVTADDGSRSDYQLLLGVRGELPQRLEFGLVGAVGDAVVYDAVYDADLTGVLLSGMAEGRDVGPLRFRTEPVDDPEAAPLSSELPSRLLGAEQSNTSIVFGEQLVCKLFRRLQPGMNPDLEVTRALTRAGSPHVASIRGWVEADLGDGPTTLAMLQTFLRTGSEGWALATASVRDLYVEADLHADEVGGDFASEAERLGAATAAVHRDLASALPTDRADVDVMRAEADAMRARLDAAVVEVEQLRPFADGLRAAYADVVEAVRGRGGLPVQRVHGDYHLGQVMRTEEGWYLLDFEGEPLKALEERTRPSSVLRDVAGMLRSFDYVAHHLLAELPSDSQLSYRAVEWAERNREAFCDGYAAEAGADPRAEQALLRAFELDKAVYEVVYEARHRPAWLRIPLGAVERLVGS